MTAYTLGANKNLAHDPREEQIALAIVQQGLALGYEITVWEGEDYAILRSADERAVMESLGSTDTDTLSFYGPSQGARVAAVVLVYGNGTDLIHDSSTGAVTDAILAPAEALADKLLMEED